MPEEVEYESEGCGSYRVSLPECKATIQVNVGLTASTNYKYHVRDKFNGSYWKAFTTDGTGKFTIATADFPKGYFTRHSGEFELKIYKASDNTLASFTINAIVYNTITMEFTNGQMEAVIPET